jgi:uncharacterized protein (TIGR00290 family)
VPKKAVVAWSTGKDCAWALHKVRREGQLEIVGLLTTMTETFGRVSMHGVREEVVRAQSAALDLPLFTVAIPFPCPNEVYERAMGAAVDDLRSRGVSQIVFGDLFLEEVRAYREKQLRGSGLQPVFPLWGAPTRALAEEMIGAGVEAWIVALDPTKVSRGLAGQKMTRALLEGLPAGVDPCGENGEFHTCVTQGPMFDRPVPVVPGPVVERDGFVFADLVLR